MEHTDFSYRTPDKKEIVKHILYENAIFDIKDVFSDRSCDDCSAVSMITPTQMLSVTFPYEASPKGHAAMANTLTEILYPNDSSSMYLDQKIYIVERVDNLFITATKDGLIAILPEQNKVTQMQYDLFEKYLKEFEKSDYVKEGRVNNILLVQDIAKGDASINVNEIDKELQELKQYITEKELVRKQNPISEFDFSNCKTSEEFMEQAELYARQLVKNSKVNLIEPINREKVGESERETAGGDER